jgi:hypothetical protein
MSERDKSTERREEPNMIHGDGFQWKLTDPQGEGAKRIIDAYLRKDLRIGFHMLPFRHQRWANETGHVGSFKIEDITGQPDQSEGLDRTTTAENTPTFMFVGTEGMSPLFDESKDRESRDEHTDGRDDR